MEPNDSWEFAKLLLENFSPIILVIGVLAMVFAWFQFTVPIGKYTIRNPSRPIYRTAVTFVGFIVTLLGLYLFDDNLRESAGALLVEPYEIKTVTILLRDELSEQDGERKWSVRTIYSIHGNKDSESETLRKKYERHDARRITRWGGSEAEKLTRSHDKYWMSDTAMTIKKDQDFVMVYGAQVEFANPNYSRRGVKGMVSLD